MSEPTRAFQPMYPWVLVKVLKREQKHGSIVLLEGSKQNKPTHEGIVVTTWAPCSKPMKGKMVDIRSELKVGDHVLFPHWAGLPVAGLDVDDYRIVKECEWGADKEGGIIGLLEGGADITEELSQRLKELFCDHVSSDKIVEMLLQEYLIINRSKGSVTLSGV